MHEFTMANLFKILMHLQQLLPYKSCFRSKILNRDKHSHLTPSQFVLPGDILYMYHLTLSFHFISLHNSGFVICFSSLS